MTTTTFALLAYNQSSYIKQSIESIFAQDIAINQIIISDDCSSDDTYNIMLEMGKSYKGPGTLIIRRNKLNLGIIGHFNKIVAISTGELIFFQAGDDISIPSRARTLLDTYIKTSPLLMHSDVYCISKQGEPIESPFGRSSRPLLWNETISLEEVAKSKCLYIGATLAASRKLFEIYEPIEYTDAYEDLVLGYRSFLAGKTIFIPKKLVGYRLGQGISATNTNPSKAHQAVLMQRIVDTSHFATNSNRYKHILDLLQYHLYLKTKQVSWHLDHRDLMKHPMPRILKYTYRLRLHIYYITRIVRLLLFNRQ
jgi:glycosyltransferase involved in cell wall biosynthesis